MRRMIRAVVILGLAASVAACSTTGQGSSGGLGESAGQTIRDHPQTTAGAGIGAAGGAVVGGLAGGTKGAVVGGLLGALAGGAIGNYVERRDAAVPQTPSPPPPTSQPQTASSPPGTAGPTVSSPDSATPRAYTNSAVVVRVDQVQAQPSLLRPGETVTLNATYSILSPPDRPVAVRESREIRLNGELVANPSVDVARQTGTYSTALPITIPVNAQVGKYEVTTMVVSGDLRSISTTSFFVQ